MNNPKEMQVAKMGRKNNITKRQHFVQRSLIISQWQTDGLVGVIGISEDRSIHKEKSKSPKSIFYEDYGYEWFYGFNLNSFPNIESIDLKIDCNHSFSVNDGEKFCKQIEDNATPIIQRICQNTTTKASFAAATPSTIYLEQSDWAHLASYIALQIVRTPQGRKNISRWKESVPDIISERSSPQDFYDKLTDNTVYLVQMGVYDKAGICDNRKLPPSLFSALKNDLMYSQPFFCCIPENERKQFILSGNPCSIISGKKTDFVIFPISPKILLCAPINSLENQAEWNDLIPKYSATDELVTLEIYAEYVGANNKLVYCTKYNSFSEIQRAILKSTEKFGAITKQNTLGYS